MGILPTAIEFMEGKEFSISSIENMMTEFAIIHLEAYKENRKKEIIQACYLQIQNIESELGDLVYKKVPEEIYNENFNNQ